MPDKLTTTAGQNLPEIHEQVATGLMLITRTVSPLLMALGFPDDLFQADNVKYEWQEDALLANSTTLSGPALAAATTLPVEAGTGTRFAIGQTVFVDGSAEIMRVVGPIAANTVEVVRGDRGTTAVDYLAGVKLIRMSTPMNECADSVSGDPSSRTRPLNYTEIFERCASVSRSAQKVKMINVPNEMAHQVMHHQLELIRNLAYTTLNGRWQVANPAGTDTSPRTMKGIIPFLQDGADSVIVDAAGGALTQDLLSEAMERVFIAGGDVRLLAAPTNQRRKLSALLEGRTRYRPDDNRLGAIVETVVTDFGEVNVLAPDIYIPGNKILLLDPNRIRLGKLGSGPAFDTEDLAKTGLCDKKQVVGEFTLEIKNAGDGGHGMIDNLAA